MVVWEVGEPYVYLGELEGNHKQVGLQVLDTVEQQGMFDWEGR